MSDELKPRAWAHEVTGSVSNRSAEELWGIDALKEHGWEPLFTQAQLIDAIEDFRLRCIDLVAFHGGSVEIEAAIRNLSAAAPKG